MRKTIDMKDHHPNYVTPYLAKDALAIARKWEAERRMPVLILAYDNIPGTCPNCSGIGLLYMKLTEKGPIGTPGDAKSVYTWFDGNEQFGKGWYKVSDTMVFTCPKCGGIKARG